MTFPGHLERLVETHVEGDVARSTENVSVAIFTWSSCSKTTVSSQPVSEDIRLSTKSIRCRTRFDWFHSRAVGLHVPVCGPNAAVKRSLDWKSTVPAEDSRSGPAAQHFVHQAVGVCQESLTTAKRKSDHPVRIDNVTGIEIRAGVVLLR